MKFLVTYPINRHPYDPAFLEKDTVVRLARAVEDAGLDAIGFTDHPIPSHRWLQSGGHDALDPFAALAFCAAVTDRILLMPNIVVVPYRNPFLLAKSVATVDRLSGGRFVLATGTGYLKSEYRALGVDFDTRNDRFDEAIEVLRGIWSTDDYSYEGGSFSARGVTADPKPAQASVPIWIGGNSKLSRRRVARYGDAWVPFPAPRVMASTSRTVPLESNADLAELLDYLWEQMDSAGRDRSEIDISYSCFAGGAPGSPEFNPEAHLEGLAELEALGVTWVGVGIPGDNPAHALEAIEQYSEEIVAKLR